MPENAFGGYLSLLFSTSLLKAVDAEEQRWSVWQPLPTLRQFVGVT